jgi:hypothetical protein
VADFGARIIFSLALAYLGACLSQSINARVILLRLDMPVDRQKQRQPRKAFRAPLPDDLVRQTEEQLALAKEFIELARELCITAWELRKMTERLYISGPTEN